MGAAEALAVRLKRPVSLIYNQSELNPPDFSTGTPGVLGDVTEAAYDGMWPLLICTMLRNQPPKLSEGKAQLNPTTRQFIHLFYHAGKPVSVVSHSQGCIIVRNACFALYLLGMEGWVRRNLAWVATGSPLSDGEVWPRPEIYHSLKDKSDPVPRIIGLEGWDDVDISTVAFNHGFIQHYKDKVTPGMLYPI